MWLELHKGSAVNLILGFVADMFYRHGWYWIEVAAQTVWQLNRVFNRRSILSSFFAYTVWGHNYTPMHRCSANCFTASLT